MLEFYSRFIVNEAHPFSSYFEVDSASTGEFSAAEGRRFLVLEIDVDTSGDPRQVAVVAPSPQS